MEFKFCIPVLGSDPIDQNTSNSDAQPVSSDSSGTSRITAKTQSTVWTAARGIVPLEKHGANWTKIWCQSCLPSIKSIENTVSHIAGKCICQHASYDARK